MVFLYPLARKVNAETEYLVCVIALLILLQEMLRGEIVEVLQYFALHTAVCVIQVFGLFEKG